MIELATLDPRLTRERLCRQAVCGGCGKRGATIQKDMREHYRQLEATGWGCGPVGAGARNEKGAGPKPSAL